MSLLRRLSSAKGPKKKSPDTATAQPNVDQPDTTNMSLDKSTDGSSSDYQDGFTTVFSYRLSCAYCNANVAYTGDTERKVVQALVRHYAELWHALEDRRRIGSIRCDDASVLSDLTGLGNNFGHSSLGQHFLSEHLQGAHSKVDVVKWCQDNVRVQVKRHMYEKAKTDGTFKSVEKEAAPEFVKNKNEREIEWEEKKKQAELERKLQRIENSALNKDKAAKATFDVIWNTRYNELKEYAEKHEGDTKVPHSYAPNILLGRWTENQRKQYRRKHNGLDKNSALTDTKEGLLDDIGFVWSLQPESRSDALGIAVMYGYTLEDFNAVSPAESTGPNNADDANTVSKAKTSEPDNGDDSNRNSEAITENSSSGDGSNAVSEAITENISSVDSFSAVLEAVTEKSSSVDCSNTLSEAKIEASDSDGDFNAASEAKTGEPHNIDDKVSAAPEAKTDERNARTTTDSK